METKISIRNQILSLRNALPINECEEKSNIITQNVLSLLSVQKAEYVLCYASYKSEVQTDILIKELLKEGKKVYLPRVCGEKMDFYRIRSLIDLIEGYKGIPEPEAACTERFTRTMWEKDKARVVMLLPGVAFSESGARIGYGKGYYDRYLSHIPCMERISLCYELQMVEAIPADTYDIPMTIIVTEEKIRHMILRNEEINGI